MAQLSIANSIPAKLEDLFGSSKDTTAPIIDTFIRQRTAVVAVPSITDPDIASVAVTVTGAALGDLVIAAAPITALPTACRQQGAYVSAANEVTIVFGSLGGSVTGADRAYNLLIASVVA